MSFLSNINFVVLILMMLTSSSERVPLKLIGSWSVGKPYNTPGPIGINAKQEKFIRGLHLVYTADHLHVCGKKISAQPIKTRTLSDNEFLQAYGFLPRVIGMKSSPITDLTLSSSDDMNACGEYEDPGVHVLIDPGGHVVMEVANDYLPLKNK